LKNGAEKANVTAPEADLSGWAVAPFTGGGYTLSLIHI